MPIPMNNINDAISAYGRTARIASGGSLGAPAGGKDVNDEFAGLVKSAINEAVRIQRHGESMSIKGLQDKADLNQVVTAVAEADLTLQTVVAVRDKVIEAYKEILRTPI